MLGKDIAIYTITTTDLEDFKTKNINDLDWSWFFDLSDIIVYPETIKIKGKDTSNNETRDIDSSMWSYKPLTKKVEINELGYGMNYGRCDEIIISFKYKNKGSNLIKAHSYDMNKELKTKDVTYFTCENTIEIPTQKTISMNLETYYVNETLLELFDLEKEVLLEVRDKQRIVEFKGFITKVDEKTTVDDVKTYTFEFKSS